MTCMVKRLVKQRVCCYFGMCCGCFLEPVQFAWYSLVVFKQVCLFAIVLGFVVKSTVV